MYDGEWPALLPALAVVLCWAVIAGVWLAGAVLTRRRGPATRERARLGPGFLVVVLGYLALRWAVPERVWEAVTVRSPWVAWVGVAVLVPGTAFTLWARTALGTLWASSAVLKEGHTLRTDGPYAVTRHPIYTGLLAVITGTVLVAGLGRWILVPLFGYALLLVKARAEERLLEGSVGEAYRDYRERVPRLLPVPGLVRSPRRGG